MADLELSCRRFVELITDYLEGGLASGDRAEIEDHLEICEGCLAYLEQMRLTIAALWELREPPDVQPATVLLEALRTRVTDRTGR